PRLTRALHAAVEQQPPPRKGIFRPKMRYAHQGGQNPPLIVVHGSGLDAVPDSYRRYLESRFRTVFQLEGTPLRIEFKSSHNPYVQGKSGVATGVNMWRAWRPTYPGNSLGSRACWCF